MENAMVIITRSNLGNLYTWVVELSFGDCVAVSVYNTKGDRLRHERMSERVLQNLLENDGEVVSIVHHTH